MAWLKSIQPEPTERRPLFQRTSTDSDQMGGDRGTMKGTATGVAEGAIVGATER